MNFDIIRKNGDLLFESIRGSHLFGLNTETSDIDTFGVFCGPEDWFLGSGKDMIPMVKSEKSDDYWDELKKYFFELGKSNPEALVSLFTPEKFILHFDPVLQPLWDIRDQLLTKECFKSFSGYAYSQIKKAKGLKKAINTDPEEVKERKNPLYFCQVPVGIGTHTLKKWLDDRKLRQECCGISRLPNSNECYALFYDWGKAKELGDNVELDKPIIGYRGILSPDDPLTSQLRLSSIPKDEEPLCWFQFNSNAYTSHCIEYKRYWDWVKNRNTARFELNKGHNYDCYAEAVTKFLTDKGWKWYHEVEDNDLVACFDKDGKLGYSKILSRTKHTDDNIEVYEFKDHLSKTMFTVTGNHRLWLRREDKTSYNLITVDDFLEESKKYKFYQYKSITSNLDDNPKFTDDELRFLAAMSYFGGASINLEDGDLTPFVSDAKAIEFINPCLKENINTQVLPYHIEDDQFLNKDLAFYAKDLFDGKEEFYSELLKLSTRQLFVYLETLDNLSIRYRMVGKISRNFEIYHPTSYYVIDYYNTLLIPLCKFHGLDFDVYDDSKIARITIPKAVNNMLSIKEVEVIRPSKYIVNSVVCFETETGTLVTGGYDANCRGIIGLGFHGNSKNISHCVRIFTMAKEIAEGKGMLLDRTSIDRDFLMSIKNHEKSYEEIMSYVENLRDDMEEAFEKSILPDCPDLDLLDRLQIDIRRKHYGRLGKKSI